MKRPGLVPLCLRSFGDGLREIISGFYFLWGGVVPRLFWMCSEVLLGLVRGACGAWLEFFKSAGAEALQKGPDPSGSDTELC